MTRTTDKLKDELAGHLNDYDYSNRLKKLCVEIEDAYEYAFEKENKNISSVDVSSEIDWFGSDNISVGVEHGFEWGVDFVIGLNELSDENFIEKLYDDHSLFNYRINPSELVIETYKMLTKL